MTSENCLTKARDCLYAARAATDPDVRVAWHDLCQGWLDLAAEIDERRMGNGGSHSGRKPTVEAPVAPASATIKLADSLRDRLSLCEMAATKG
jgi:hypothetical protein